MRRQGKLPRNDVVLKVKGDFRLIQNVDSSGRLYYTVMNMILRKENSCGLVHRHYDDKEYAYLVISRAHKCNIETKNKRLKADLFYLITGKEYKDD